MKLANRALRLTQVQISALSLGALASCCSIIALAFAGCSSPDPVAAVDQDSGAGADAVVAQDTGTINDSGGNVLDAYVPPGCDTRVDPRDSPPCVTNAGGVFVSKTALVNGDGTKESPFTSISVAASAAVAANKGRVFVCGTGYTDKVVIKRGKFGLFGGFDCSTWKGGGAATKVQPFDAGYVIDIEKTSDVVVQDFEFVPQPGTAASVSSIAARAVEATVLFQRVLFTPGNGFKGADGAPGQKGADGLAGNRGVYQGAPGAAKVCACPGGESSTGGAGGAEPFGLNDPVGKPGLPTILLSPGGAGGLEKGTGQDGASSGDLTARPGTGGNRNQNYGALSLSNDWAPSRAASGENGKSGQGGGGGGGGSTPPSGPFPGSSWNGGSGGCGGCGGIGAAGGANGGASIGVLSVKARITLSGGMVSIAVSGSGGSGGDYFYGPSAGGSGGLSSDNNLRNGGSGGSSNSPGAGGGGGGGGISVGVLYTVIAPQILSSTISLPPGPAAGGIGGKTYDPTGTLRAQTGFPGISVASLMINE